MQERTRFLIKNVDEGIWLNRMADGLTKNMFAALWFKSQDEAQQWMKGMYAPKDDGYEIVETVTQIWEVERSEREHESI